MVCFMRIRALAKRAAIVLVATVGLSVGVAGPASAHEVVGTWSDNHMICKYADPCVNSGNLVKLWQSILWADGLYSDVDGVFGPNTHNATVAWQTKYVDDVDGWVGSETWSQAEFYTVNGPWTLSHPYRTYTYLSDNSARELKIRVNYETNVWSFRHPFTGVWTSTSHGS